MVIHPCAKYGKPMSKQKKRYGTDKNLQRQTDRQTDRETVIAIYPLPRNFAYGGIIMTYTSTP